MVLALAFVPIGGSAQRGARDHVDCGMTVTTDLTLTQNITGCSGDGLDVVATGVTIDLGGHTIRGTGSGTGAVLSGEGITVQNGTIEGFATGVDTSGDQQLAALRNLVVDQNGLGVSARQGHGLVIDHSAILQNSDDGVRLTVAPQATISNSLIARNGGAGIDVPVDSSDAAHFTNDTVVGNAGAGIFVVSSTTTATNNVVTGNGGGGIVAGESLAPILGPAYVFSGNNVSENTGLGLSACVLDPLRSPPDPCATGKDELDHQIGMTDGGGNVATGNTDARQCLNISCGTPTDCGTATLTAGVKTLPSPARDNDSGGLSEAFHTTAVTTGPVSSICLFVAPSSKASEVVVGIYADDGGHPGALLTQGMLTDVTNGDFNTVRVPTVSLDGGAEYWIAVLGPQGSGKLRIEDACCGHRSVPPVGLSETSDARDLLALPPAWTTGKQQQDGPLLAWAGA
jgi:parallel beta helix pectate lyase-like protein